jgi:two-component system, NarL family, response regulator DegU
MKTIKVILVDDHQIFRDGIISLFADVNDIKIVGVASNGNDAISRIKTLKPDVMILDISMPRMSGLELIPLAKEITPLIKILILSMHTSEDYIFKAVRAGANGYLPKQNTTKEELLKAIRTISDDYEYFSDSVTQVMQQNFVKKARTLDVNEIDEYYSLTKREREILKMVVEGLGNLEIADKLFIHIRTVETHKNNIMQKLKLKNSVELVKFAIRYNLLDL